MDDLISKASVCEILADIYPTDGEKVVAVKEIDKAYETIINLPYAERHGRWIDIEHAPNSLLYATCSVCGKRQTVEFTSYCGNCGAKMDLENDEDE